MSTAPVATLVRRSLVTIADSASVEQALAVARAEHIHHLPLLRDGVLVGVVCTCDLYAAAPQALARDCVKAPPVTLPPEAPLAAAVDAMNVYDVGSVILARGAKPEGIVTRGDLLAAAPAAADLLAKVRCACCGLTRHLGRSADGVTLCIFCQQPGEDGRLTHISAE